MKQSLHKSDAVAAQEYLLESLNAALEEAETLLSHAASASGEQATKLCAQAVDSLRAARERLYGTQESVFKQGKQAALVADHYMHDNPWRVATTVGVVGLLLGLLISRR